MILRKRETLGAKVANNGVIAEPLDRGDAPAPDPEVRLRPQRRTYTAEYKEQIIAAVDACRHGEIGTLLRHEGLTSSTVSRWRKEREQKIQKALEFMKEHAGPDPRDERIALLEHQLKRTREDLAKARAIIGVQKKVSELLALGFSDGNGEPS